MLHGCARQRSPCMSVCAASLALRKQQPGAFGKRSLQLPAPGVQVQALQKSYSVHAWQQSSGLAAGTAVSAHFAA